jgi:hypothetical protein
MSKKKVQAEAPATPVAASAEPAESASPATVEAPAAEGDAQAKTSAGTGGPKAPADSSSWESALGKPGRTCCITNREFVEGDHYVSTLEAGEEGLVRRDYDPEHFDEDRSDVFAFWRHRIHADEDDNKPRPLDLNFLADFFRRLQANPAGGPREVAYIVALLLVRKKVLVLEGSEPIELPPVAEGEESDAHAPKENLIVRFAKEEDAQALKVPVPELSEEKMEVIRDDLGRIFNLGDTPKKKKSDESSEAEKPAVSAEAPAPESDAAST